MAPRLTPLRLLLLLAGIAGTVALTSACGGGQEAQAAAENPPVLNYSSSVLSFAYPSAWTASEPVLSPTESFHFHPLVYLSTQPVHKPCRTRGNETTCSFPVRHLQPGGVLAAWAFPYFPPLSGPPRRGKRIQVDGHPAWRTDGRGGDCRRIGANRTTQVYVKLGRDYFISFTACLRGPHLAQAEKSVDALLASTRFASQ